MKNNTLTFIEGKIDDLIGPDGVRVAVQPTAPTSADVVGWARKNPIPAGLGAGAVALIVWRVLR